jgi:hypothetical protein
MLLRRPVVKFVIERQVRESNEVTNVPRFPTATKINSAWMTSQRVCWFSEWSRTSQSIPFLEVMIVRT